MARIRKNTSKSIAYQFPFIVNILNSEPLCSSLSQPVGVAVKIHKENIEIIAVACIETDDIIRLKQVTI